MVCGPDTILHTSAWPLQTVAALTEKLKKERTTTANPSNILAGGLWSWEERVLRKLPVVFLSRPSMAGGAFLISGLSAVFLAYTRSVCAAYFCGAALGCALSVKVIKIFVRQPRPEGATTLKSYGYESHHRLCLRLQLAKV